MFCMKLFFLAALGCAFAEFTPDEPWEVVRQFNEGGLIGPPKSQIQTFQLSAPYKVHAETVIQETTATNHDQTICFQFNYFMSVPDEFGLKVVINRTGVPDGIVVWSRYGSTYDTWQKAKFIVEMKANDKLNFVAKTVSGVIALNTIKYDTNNCKYGHLDTDFESDQLNSWNAHIVNASSPFKDAVDHASNSPDGRVAFIYNGKIEVVRMVPKEAKCFKFWFNRPISVPPRQSTEFFVYVNDVLNFRTQDEIQPAGEWIRAQIPLKFTENLNSIRIVTNDKTSMTRPGVLFDDLSFTETECEPAVSCKFGEGTCGWNHQVSSKHSSTWKVGSGRVQELTAYTTNVVPVIPNGHLYSDFTVTRPQTGIEIRSDYLVNPNEHCARINITYNRVSADDKFSLEHVTQSFDFVEKLDLWNLDVARARTAIPTQYVEETFEIEVPKSLRPRRLGFYARSSHPLSRMGVKEINVREGRCKPLPTDTPTQAPFVPSKLDRNVLIVADELLKNSKTNVERVLDLIKIEDPIKAASMNVLRELSETIQQVEKNLK